jgi:uncharacterized iron-regulated protein
LKRNREKAYNLRVGANLNSFGVVIVHPSNKQTKRMNPFPLRIHSTRLFMMLGLALMMTAFTASDKIAWKLYNSKGEPTTWSAVLAEAQKADVVLFGELHNNAISHWLQLELTMDLYATDSSNLILGAEMFESDNQRIMNEYLTGVIRERDFEAEARLWNNYKTDYKPLVTFAAGHGLAFIATNIPRRYAALVNRLGFEGLDTLPDETKRYFAPLPVPFDPELPGYKAMLQMGGPAKNASNNLPKAQAIKDATMAWFIVQAFSPGKRFLHFHGSYHSDNYEGIVWYLKQYKPQLKVMTIATVEQSDITTLDSESINKADVILVVNERVTKTY